MTKQTDENRRAFMKRCATVATVAPAVALIASAATKPANARNAYVPCSRYAKKVGGNNCSWNRAGW